ncbi:MAG: 16S rRNA (adenine(1518)-N(6)/adenine(1519)-N(6))-dimethyltransferase RsmA [Chthoniobacterales bacterium]
MNISEIRKILNSRMRDAKRSMGQNFLIDKNFASWVVSEIEISLCERIIEIGPGLGALTGALVETGREVLALELDRDWAARLRETFREDNFILIEGDAMDFDLRKLWDGGATVLVGNLPYNVSTALLAKFAEPLSPVREMVVMVQNEVADRIVAGPGTRAYGAYSLALQLDWHVEKLRVLGPENFYPRPKVHSAVVRLRRKADTEILRCRRSWLRKLVRAGFQQRRKQLKKLLPVASERVIDFLESIGLPITSRAENLTLENWVELANRMGESVSVLGGDEILDVVDGKDEIVGRAERSHVHAEGLRHRAVHILIENEVGELFLQKRSPWKDINPGVWDSSAAGHVSAGEDYDRAAMRELEEELGVRDMELRRLGKLLPCEATGNEFIQVYRGSREGRFKLEEMEISCGAFFPRGQIREWLVQGQEDFSPVFRLCWELFNDCAP